MNLLWRAYCTIAREIGLTNDPHRRAWSIKQEDIGTQAVFAVKEWL